MTAPGPTAADERADAATATDIVHAYRLFLRRDPESPAAIAAKAGRPVNAILAEILTSSEFAVSVRDVILSAGRPDGRPFDGAIDTALARWAAARLPLSDTGHVAVGHSRTWPALLGAVLGDDTFSTAVGPAAIASVRPPFPDRLAALDEPKAAAAGSPAGRSWLLVTGAARSGTTLLHALLSEHDEVALLTEYGLDTLVRRIDALVGRPAMQCPDWKRGMREADARFAAVAGFYETRPGSEVSDPARGEIPVTGFATIADALFDALGNGKTPRVVGDKLPMTGDWLDVDTVAERLPGLRFLIVLRDPADTIRSSLVRREAALRGLDDWPVRSVQDAVADWVAAWHRSRALVDRFGAAVHLVKYEDLCADPTAAMAAIYGFLGLPAIIPKAAVSVKPRFLSLHTAAEESAIQRFVGAISAAWPHLGPQELLAQFAAIEAPYRMGVRTALPPADGIGVTATGALLEQPADGATSIRTARIRVRHGEEQETLLVELWFDPQILGSETDARVVVRCNRSPDRLLPVSRSTGRVAFAAVPSEDAPGEAVIAVSPAPSVGETSERLRLVALRVSAAAGRASTPTRRSD